MNDFIGGGIMVAALAVALFFVRSWRRTGDRFFLLFALAFALLSGSAGGCCSSARSTSCGTRCT
jgi:hypothetical protein